jgi:hypothetical protein
VMRSSLKAHRARQAVSGRKVTVRLDEPGMHSAPARAMTYTTDPSRNLVSLRSASSCTSNGLAVPTTESEAALWRLRRGRQPSVSFKREVRLPRYIVDF